jgi:hypothetical protein
VLWIADAPTELPGDTDGAVAGAVVAALLDPDSFPETGSTSSSSSATVGISEADFADALGNWHSAWSATTGDLALISPCRGIDLSSGGSFGEESSLGANGQQATSGFTNPAEAQARLQAIGDGLSRCKSAAYDVHAVPIQGGSVTVAAGTGADADVAWFVQDGRQIAYAVIPGGDTSPPDSVTAAVGLLLASELRADATPKP